MQVFFCVEHVSGFSEFSHTVLFSCFWVKGESSKKSDVTCREAERTDGQRVEQTQDQIKPD